MCCYLQSSATIIALQHDDDENETRMISNMLMSIVDRVARSNDQITVSLHQSSSDDIVDSFVQLETSPPLSLPKSETSSMVNKVRLFSFEI